MTATRTETKPRQKRMNREQEFFSFLRDYIDEHGHSPSYDEIRDSLGLRSKGSVSNLMRKLHDEGKISYTPRKARTIRIV